MAATNRRSQALKGKGNKKTSPYRMEKRIKANTKSKPKYPNRWDTNG